MPIRQYSLYPVGKVQKVIYAAEDLQEAVEKNAPSDITDKLMDFIDIYVRIELTTG